MNSMDRFVRWLTGEEVVGGKQGSTAEFSTGSRAVDSSGLPVLVTNAEPYGVTVEPVAVTPGTAYWRAIRVHHLGPQENGGRHHLYLDALKTDGSRAFNSQAAITWEGGEKIVTVDKPINEPGTNFPMFKWQKCSVVMQGMASDQVHGISSSHPDEPNPDGSQSGNTLFHHSFLVIFQEVIAPHIVTTGTIRGHVENSQDGLIVELVQADNVVASTPVESDGTFLFSEVDPGDYLASLQGQRVPVQVQAGQTAEVSITLAVAASESIIEGSVRGGGGLILQLILGDDVVAEGALGESGSFRLRNLGPGDYQIQVLRPGETDPLVKSFVLVMDGHNQQSIGLTIPSDAPEPAETTQPIAKPDVDETKSGVRPEFASISGSPLEHYVLFAETDTPASRAQLTALLPQLAQKNLGFGFDRAEAAKAEAVTAIGDEDAIPETVLDSLIQLGIHVRRLAGTPEEIVAQL